MLCGLTRPIRCLSLEFVGDNLEAVRQCLERLETLGRHEFNYSTGESLAWSSPRWMDAAALFATLCTHVGPMGWGDVYARAAPDAAR